MAEEEPEEKPADPYKIYESLIKPKPKKKAEKTEEKPKEA